MWSERREVQEKRGMAAKRVRREGGYEEEVRRDEKGRKKNEEIHM